MAAAFCRSGQISPTNFTRPLEKVFDDATHTGQINLVGRKLKEYPKLADKYDLVDTSTADLSRNRLHEIPPAICDYRSMERLVCYHNVIRCLPDTILQLQCLSYLNLSCNQLSHIPPFICRIQSLEVLVVSNNRLVSIPEELGRLDKLTELDVSCNEINILPSQLGDLESLRVLNVRKNLLVELPLELSRLKLRKFDFSCNKIGVLPPEYRLMETLDILLVDHNPLTSPPAHICTRGRVHIMKYLQIEAIKEDKKRGLLGDNDLRRYFRKSSSQQKALDELSALNSHHLDPGGDIENQRDSGYITTEEKPHWNTNGVSKLTDDLPGPPPYPGRPTDSPQQNGSPSPRTGYKPKFTPPSPQFNHLPTNQNTAKGHVINTTANQNGGRVQVTPVNQAIEEEFPPPTDPEVDEFTRVSGKKEKQHEVSLSVKGGTNHPRDLNLIGVELQRQKSEYEARKKKAELLRRQREGEQKAQQNQIVTRVLEERGTDGRILKLDEDLSKEESIIDERTEEKSFVEQQREEARKRLEEKTRHRQRPDKLPLKSSHRLPPPPAELLQPTAPRSPPKSLPLNSLHAKTNPKHPSKHPSSQSQVSKNPPSQDPKHPSQVSKHPSQASKHPSQASKHPSQNHKHPTQNPNPAQNLKHPTQNPSPAQDPKHPSHASKHPSQNPKHPSQNPKHPSQNPKHPTQASPQHTRTGSDLSNSSMQSLPMYASPRPKVHDHYQTNSLPRSPPKRARQAHPHQLTSQSQQPGQLYDIPSMSPPSVPLNQSGQPTLSRDHEAPPHCFPHNQSRHPMDRSDSLPVAVPPLLGHHRQMSDPEAHWIPDPSSQQGRPSGQQKQEGEFMNRHDAMMRQTHQEASTIRRKIEDEKDRLLKNKKEPLYNYLTKKSSVSDDDTTGQPDVHNTSQTSTHSSNSSLPTNGKDAFNVRLPEELRYINPNFTVRRHFEQAREEMEQIDRLRRDIESRLKVQLPPDVPSALKDGIVLCHLANYVRPRSVSSIHVPPPSATSLSIGKCRRNVENFLEACRKIGVDERDMCSAADILEERGVMTLSHTVHQLLNLNNPEASNV